MSMQINYYLCIELNRVYMEWFIIIVIALVIVLCVYSGEQTDSDASTVNVKKQSSNVTTPNSSPCSRLLTDEDIDEVLKRPDTMLPISVSNAAEEANADPMGISEVI